MPTINFIPTKNYAAEMDRSDPLKDYREKFFIPKQKNGGDVIYFCGNSLGLQPKSVRSFVEQELQDWETLGVEGHFHAQHPWMPYHEYLTEQTARLVGAKPGEAVVMNSLTTNLHLLMVSFYRPTKKRYKILVEHKPFPSDLYAVRSQLSFHGYNPDSDLIELSPRQGEVTLRTEDILETIEREGDSIALLLLGGVNYYSGQLFDMKRITDVAHKQGCVVGFDLAHAAGNVPLHLHDWNVDVAAWCSYKYLNAGPGSVGGAFVHERHAKNFSLPRFAGWWSNNKQKRFLMAPEYDPMEGAEGWQLSNPPILQMAALRASMEIFDEVGTERLRAKSELLTNYLEFLIKEKSNKNISIITPGSPAERGCQLSLLFGNNGKNIFEKLTSNGIICDWREPDVIRVAPVPLYSTFADIFKFSEILFTSV